VKNLTLTAIAAVLALGACSKTDTAANDNAVMSNEPVSEAGTNAGSAAVDTAFLNEAMQGDNGEVAIGQLAQRQGASQKVKDFGKLLIDDHGAHKQELKTLAESAGVTVTDEPSPEAKTNLEKLKALSGAAFDKQFKSMMVADHTKDIAKYEKQASSSDAQTAALAQKTLPVLRKHLDAANAL
jgi:putative membrane protein